MGTNVKGILGEKLGMTQVWDDANRVVPVTVVKAGPCVVTQVRTPEVDGYEAVQIGFGAIDPRKVTKPQAGHFTKAGVTPRRHLVEIRTDDAASYTLGQEISAELFEAGQSVDVVGTTKGKGFAGVMKRHGFKGFPASHGTERKHRAPGSIASRAVNAGLGGGLKRGKRMAGHMGHEQVTSKNHVLVAIDEEKNLLIVKGTVAGPAGGYCVVKTAKSLGTKSGS